MKRIIDPCHELEDLGGGRHRLTAHLRPIAYRRAGAWRRITSIVGATGDPALPLGVDELVQFRVRDRLAGSSPVLHFGKGNSHVRITPLGTRNIVASVADNTVRFDGAWDGADLLYEIGGHILRKSIYLHAGHPRSFAFRIDDHAGLDLATLTTPEFRVLDPVLTHPTTGLTIPLSWAKSQQGGKTVLTVMLPAGDYAGWVLDPTLTLQPDATEGLDTFISSSEPTTNYGTNAAIQVGWTASGSLVRRTLIKFDLTDLPDAAVITSATLTCVETWGIGTSTKRVYRTKRAWVEDQATWNIYNTGNSWSTAGGFHTDDCEQTDIGSWSDSGDITTRVIALSPTSKAALDLGNGWLLKDDAESGDSNARNFAASDNATAADRPKLVVEYTLGATRPSYLYVGRNLRRPT